MNLLDLTGRGPERAIRGLGFTFSLLLGGALGAASASPSQFVFFDEVVVLDGGAVQSLERRGPSDLQSPVDYTRGRLYIRFEILEKPSELPLRPAFFLWQRQPDGLRHCGVGRHEIPDLTEVGVYYLDGGNPGTWWHGDYEFPEWDQPFDKMALVPWVGNTGQKLTVEDCWSHCYKGDDLDDHVPLVYHATGIWVAPDASLIPPADWECPEDWPVEESKPSGAEPFEGVVSETEWLILDRVIVHDDGEGMDKTMGFSEFPLPAAIPSDWVEPVAMNSGTMHCRLEVLSKPTEEVIHYQLGFQWVGGCEGHNFKEKFPRNDLHPIRDPGVYTWSQAIPTFWEPECQAEDPIDWSERMTRLLVVVWDEHPRIVDDRWGRGWDGMDLDRFYPMTVHFQAVVVAPGAEFAGWDRFRTLRPEK